MDKKICISKKITYLGIFIFFVCLFIALSQLVLQSNQAKNSRAADIESTAKSLVFPASPPSIDQQIPANIYKVSLDNSGYIELLGIPPTLRENKYYSIYLKRNESFIHLDTFAATHTTISEKFSYWKPSVKITSDDVQNGIFYLFQVN